MDSIVLFLKEHILPEGKSEADKVWKKAPQFWLSEDQKLYKRSFSGAIFAMHTPWGIRTTPEEVTWRDMWKPHKRQILISQSLHSGILMAEHAEGSTRVCEEVWPMPKIRPKHSSTRGSNPLSSPWPFAQWGLDIVGPFPNAVVRDGPRISS